MLLRIETLCKERGLKMTGSRRVVGRVLSEATDHPDVEEIHRRSARIDPKISLATVYRTMRLLEQAGVIERLDLQDGRARYEANRKGHHHHLIDVDTGSVIEFDSAELEQIKAEIAQKLGYTILDDRLTLYGVRKLK